MGYSPWGQKKLDTTEQLHFHFHFCYYDKLSLVLILKSIYISVNMKSAYCLKMFDMLYF